MPSGGGVGTARAIARAHVAFACGGDEPGLREATLRELTAPAVAPSPGFRDACLEVEIRLSLGFGYVMSQLGTHRDDPGRSRSGRRSTGRSG